LSELRLPEVDQGVEERVEREELSCESWRSGKKKWTGVGRKTAFAFTLGLIHKNSS
jgi:hypothetical protein